ncbi:MAG: hypothetical protein V1742_00150 [Pseudomonadota bacterium]
MTKTKKPLEVNEVKVLFPEEQVGPYILRPWTLTQFGKVLPTLIDIVKSLTPLGLTFDNCEIFIQDHLAEIGPVLIPFLPGLIAITLRIEPEEVDRDIVFDDGLAIALTIFVQNGERVKNFLPRLLSMMGTGAKDTPLH